MAKVANGDWNGLVLMTGEGDYVTPGWNESWEQRWMFIQGAPGTDITKVRFTGRDGNRCNISKLAFRRVTMASATDNNLLYPSRPGKAHWFDDCQFKGISPATAFAAVHRNATGYHTSVTIDSFRYGGQNARLMRDVHVSNLTEDSFRPGSWTLMVNCSARNVSSAGTSAHPDVVQMYGGPFENTIIYGLDVGDGTVQSQGISPTTVKDLAVVNCLLDPLPSVLGMNLEAPMNHYLILHSTLNQGLRVRIDSLHNLVLKNSVLRPAVHDGITTDQFNDMAVVDNLHVISTGLDTIINDTNELLTFGKDSTVFNGYGSLDLSPADGSPLINRTTNVWVPVDVYGNIRGNSTAIGAIAWAGEHDSLPISDFQLPIEKQENAGLSVWPNPMGDHISIICRDAINRVSTISVYDQAGNTLFRSSPRQNPGESKAVWDGTDLAGQTAAPGIYFISDGLTTVRIIKTE
jgi:hypothetical protein